MKVESTIELPAPPKEVFAIVMDPHRLEEWVTAHDEIVEAPDGPLELGSEFRQKLKVAGIGFSVTWEVTELEPPSLAAWEGRGPAGSRARARYELEPAAGGTLFHYGNEFELPGGKLAAAAGRAIGEEKGRAEAEESLQNLRDLLQGRSLTQAADAAARRLQSRKGESDGGRGSVCTEPGGGDRPVARAGALRAAA